jgi:hypothetical protein
MDDKRIMSDVFYSKWITAINEKIVSVMREEGISKEIKTPTIKIDITK